MRTRLTIAAIVIVLGAIAFGALRFFGQQAPQSTATTTPIAASPTPEPSASAALPSPSAVIASGPPTPTPVPTPTAVPTPTTDPNVLAMTNGAFVRRWTLGGVQDGPEGLAQNGGVSLVPAFAGPVEFVFELPSAAHIDRVGVTLRGAKPAQVEVAVSTDARAFRTIGRVQTNVPADNDAERFVDAGTDARFVRFTVRHTPKSELRVVRVAGYGIPGPPQRGALSGTWISADALTGSPDVVFTGAKGSVPDALPTQAQYNPRISTEQDGVLALFECTYRSETWHAPVIDNAARFTVERLQLAGKGNLLVGYANSRYVMAIRSSKQVPACAPSIAGNGPTVLALVRVVTEPAPELDPAYVSGYRYERRLLPLMDAAQLQRARFVILDGDCAASKDLSPRQQHMLLQWVAAGHKLIIRDADVCSSSDYSFLPYRFTTVATGARGARGGVLAIADPSTLGSGPSDPAHVLDTEAYLKAPSQQIGDADIIQTDDPRWCGHLFSTNALGAAGWVHAYARYGRGLIIYNGFDRDDLSGRAPAALRLVQLEYAQPAQAELPCNARVAAMLALYPSVDTSLPAGKATVLRVPMRLSYAAKQQAAQNVTLSIAGDARYRASVAPSRVHLAPGAGSPIVATVQLPAGWSGSHAFTVTATATPQLTAQATIRIDGSVALAKAFESQRRVRIYGIHFDVDSAKIQPRSEATIAQIAQVLGAHPDWKMRVEGHTDSDGGAAYNKALSDRRAQSVVSDLVTHYHIARSRLTSAGFGLTHPVAANTTEAGKALNRRVELVRL